MVRYIVWPNSVDRRHRIANFLHVHRCASAVRRLELAQLEFVEDELCRVTYTETFIPIDTSELMDVVAASANLRELSFDALCGDEELPGLRIWDSRIQLPVAWPPLRKLALLLDEHDDQRDLQWSMVERCASTLQHLVCSVYGTVPAKLAIGLPALRHLTIYGDFDLDSFPSFVSQLMGKCERNDLRLEVDISDRQLRLIEPTAARKISELVAWEDPQGGSGWLWSTSAFRAFTTLRRLQRWPFWSDGPVPVDFGQLPATVEDIEIIGETMDSIKALIEQLRHHSILPALKTLDIRTDLKYEEFAGSAHTQDLADQLRQVCADRGIALSCVLDGHGPL